MGFAGNAGPRRPIQGKGSRTMVDEELLNELGRVSFPQGSAEGGHSR